MYMYIYIYIHIHIHIHIHIYVDLFGYVFKSNLTYQKCIQMEELAKGKTSQ